MPNQHSSVTPPHFVRGYAARQTVNWLTFFLWVAIVTAALFSVLP